MESSLFQLIKKTTQTHRNHIVSAYKDNCSFVSGPVIEQFAPTSQDGPDYFRVTDIIKPAYVEAVSGGEVLYKKNKMISTPGEMEKITVKKENLTKAKDTITVSVRSGK